MCLVSYVVMSSKTQSKKRGKMQPPKTVQLSESQKNYHQIYMYKPQDCQRRKGCCWNIYVITLDYTLSLPTGSYIYYQVFPFSTDIRAYRYWCKYGFMYTCEFIFVVSVFIKVRNQIRVGSCHPWDTWKWVLFPDCQIDSWHNLFYAGTLQYLRQ